MFKSMSHVKCQNKAFNGLLNMDRYIDLLLGDRGGGWSFEILSVGFSYKESFLLIQIKTNILNPDWHYDVNKTL